MSLATSPPPTFRVLLVGPMGAGKKTYAHRLSEALHSRHAGPATSAGAHSQRPQFTIGADHAFACVWSSELPANSAAAAVFGAPTSANTAAPSAFQGAAPRPTGAMGAAGRGGRLAYTVEFITCEVTALLPLLLPDADACAHCAVIFVGDCAAPAENAELAEWRDALNRHVSTVCSAEEVKRMEAAVEERCTRSAAAFAQFAISADVDSAAAGASLRSAAVAGAAARSTYPRLNRGGMPQKSSEECTVLGAEFLAAAVAVSKAEDAGPVFGKAACLLPSMVVASRLDRFDDTVPFKLPGDQQGTAAQRARHGPSAIDGRTFLLHCLRATAISFGAAFATVQASRSGDNAFHRPVLDLLLSSIVRRHFTQELKARRDEERAGDDTGYSKSDVVDEAAEKAAEDPKMDATEAVCDCIGFHPSPNQLIPCGVDMPEALNDRAVAAIVAGNGSAASAATSTPDSAASPTAAASPGNVPATPVSAANPYAPFAVAESHTAAGIVDHQEELRQRVAQLNPSQGVVDTGGDGWDDFA